MSPQITGQTDILELLAEVNEPEQLITTLRNTLRSHIHISSWFRTNRPVPGLAETHNISQDDIENAIIDLIRTAARAGYKLAPIETTTERAGLANLGLPPIDPRPHATNPQGAYWLTDPYSTLYAFAQEPHYATKAWHQAKEEGHQQAQQALAAYTAHQIEQATTTTA